RLVLGVPIAFLETADQLLLVSFHLGQVIVRQLAPLGFRSALELRPFALEDVFIHVLSPFTLQKSKRCAGSASPHGVMEEVLNVVGPTGVHGLTSAGATAWRFALLLLALLVRLDAGLQEFDRLLGSARAGDCELLAAL